MDVIESTYSAGTRTAIYSRSLATLDAKVRAVEKHLRGMLPGNTYSKWHQNKQFPPLKVAQVREMTARLQSATGRFGGLDISEFRNNIFKVTQKERN